MKFKGIVCMVKVSTVKFRSYMHIHGREPILRYSSVEVTIEHSDYDDMMTKITEIIRTRIGTHGLLILNMVPSGDEITSDTYEQIANRQKICVTIDNRDVSNVGAKVTDSPAELHAVLDKLEQRIMMLEKSMK